MCMRRHCLMSVVRCLCPEKQLVVECLTRKGCFQVYSEVVILILLLYDTKSKY